VFYNKMFKIHQMGVQTKLNIQAQDLKS
jgi:hypothetical protein